MEIQIIQVPYDSGHENIRTGSGPIYLIDAGLDAHLRDQGHSVHVSRVRSERTLPTENGTGFDVMRLLAEQVQSAVDKGRLPVVLAGNCNSCVGTLAGMAEDRPGIVWFDAHGDFNTPDTTATGFLDGMGLAMASGRGWQSLVNAISGFHPVADDRIVHVGSRDLDPQEKEMLAGAGIPLITASPNDEMTLLTDLANVLDALKTRMDKIYLHIDVDVLDTGKGQPNGLAVPGGLPPTTIIKAIEAIKTRVDIAACAIASYDPTLDEARSYQRAIVDLITVVADPA